MNEEQIQKRFDKKYKDIVNILLYNPEYLYSDDLNSDLGFDCEEYEEYYPFVNESEYRKSNRNKARTMRIAEKFKDGELFTKNELLAIANFHFSSLLAIIKNKRNNKSN